MSWRPHQGRGWSWRVVCSHIWTPWNCTPRLLSSLTLSWPIRPRGRGRVVVIRWGNMTPLLIKKDQKISSVVCLLHTFNPFSQHLLTPALQFAEMCRNLLRFTELYFNAQFYQLYPHCIDKQWKEWCNNGRNFPRNGWMLNSPLKDGLNETIRFSNFTFSQNALQRKMSTKVFANVCISLWLVELTIFSKMCNFSYLLIDQTGRIWRVRSMPAQWGVGGRSWEIVAGRRRGRRHGQAATCTRRRITDGGRTPVRHRVQRATIAPWRRTRVKLKGNMSLPSATWQMNISNSYKSYSESITTTMTKIINYHAATITSLARRFTAWALTWKM